MLRGYWQWQLLTIFIMVTWRSQITAADTNAASAMPGNDTTEEAKGTSRIHRKQAEEIEENETTTELEEDPTMCQFENEVDLSGRYPSTLVINFAVDVDLRYRGKYWIENPLYRMQTLEANRICNHLLKVAKILGAEYFSGMNWCRDSIIYSGVLQELSNLSVYIPLRRSEQGFPRSCMHLSEEKYRERLNSHVSFAFNHGRKQVKITVDEKLHEVHVMSATVQLLKKGNMILQDPWLPTWDETAKTLLFNWLNESDHLKNLVSFEFKHEDTSTVGVYNLELVWDVDLENIYEDGYWAKSLTEYFRDKTTQTYLGKMQIKNSLDLIYGAQKDRPVDVFDPIRSALNEIATSPRENCSCNPLKSMNTLLVTLNAEADKSTEARAVYLPSADVPLADRILVQWQSGKSNVSLPVKNVHVAENNHPKERKKSYAITMLFSLAEEHGDTQLIEKTRNKVKQLVDIRKLLPKERFIGESKWKAATTLCYISEKPRLYLEWALQVQVTSTLEALERFVDHFTSELPQIVAHEGLQPHIVSNTIAYSRRIGTRALFEVRTIINTNSLIEVQPKLAERIDEVLAKIVLYMEESSSFDGGEVKMYSKTAWLLRTHLCLDSQTSYLGEQ